MRPLPRASASERSAAPQTSDLVAGFLVFLIALPLSLGIAMASSFPPIAGIITAVVGGLLATFCGSARLTIKGPAAGLIVIGLCAVSELGHGDSLVGYKRALATIVIAALLQITFSLVRAGALGDFFPTSVVHGMLAAIGVIICSKQVHTLLGVTPEPGEPVHLLAQIPRSVLEMNPEVALIGLLSLLILFGWTHLPWRALRQVPPQLVVVVLSVLLASSFDLGHEHHYRFQGHDFTVGPQFLIDLPGSVLSAVQLPDFSEVFSATSLKFVLMFALVGSLESLLSAKAVDQLDPQRRRSDLDADLLAVGVGNLIAGLLGGLPMITEIVRSSANISAGAKTRWSNFFHGLFLLVCVAGVPWLLARIPLAALAAMLIYTGLRLASPLEFAKTWRIGREQLLVFASTIVVTVATDLLLGVLAGMLLEVALYAADGMPLRNTFRPRVQTLLSADAVILKVGHAAVFSNYLTIKRHLDTIPSTHGKVIIDLRATRIVDHTVMEKLHQLEQDWARDGRQLQVTGLEEHETKSEHPLAARRKKASCSLEQAVS